MTNITQPLPEASVREFIEGVENDRRRRDSITLLERMGEWTGMKPVLWGNGLAGAPGSAIIGYGLYHYRYESGREGDFFLTGFSPRKANIAVYIMPGFGEYGALLERLGPHRHSVSCLYLTNLERNDTGALGEMVRNSIMRMKERYEWRAS